MNMKFKNKYYIHFNTEKELWKAFMELCRYRGTTATTVLNAFLKTYLGVIEK
jgi:hypothetical protein